MAKSNKRKMSKKNTSREYFELGGSEINDYTDTRSKEKMIKQMFARMAEDVRKVRTEHSHLVNELDTDLFRRKRRQTAVLHTTDTVINRVGTICPDQSQVFSILEEWATVNSIPIATYDMLENECDLILAAALWMLDRIRENGKMQDALKLLPTDDCLDEVYIPDLYDPCYSIEIIRSMVYVIQSRNNDCIGLHSNKQSNPSDFPRYLIDEYTALGRHHQDVTSRKRFEALLELIDQDSILKATVHFEEKIWEWVERYYACRACYVKMEVEHEKRYLKFIDKIEDEKERIRQMKTGAAKQRKTLINHAKRFPLTDTFQELNSFQYSKPSIASDPVLYMNSLMEEGERLTEERDVIDDKIFDLIFSSYELCNAPFQWIAEEIGTQAAENISGFEIGDPYELCFALLYLIDTDSDLPWLYYPGICLMKNAAAHLPWYFYNYEEDEDEYGFDSNSEGQEYAAMLLKNSQVPELLDWYRLSYIKRIRGVYSEEKSNLAQIVYEITGGVMPRNTHRYDTAVAEFAKYGITGKKTLVPLLHCLSLLGEGRHQSNDWRVYRDFELSSEGNDCNVEDGDKQIITPEMYQEKIRALKAENNQLKQSLHDVTREIKDVKRKMEDCSDLQRQEHQELVDLRERIFNQAQDSERIEQLSTEISFPYTPKKRTVIFGGHESWVKVIKPMLPEVRFVSRNVSPNPNLIRYADIIWLQPNALAHKDYYKIMNIARTYRIPVRYFGYASAEKCAEQLAVADMEN